MAAGASEPSRDADLDAPDGTGSRLPADGTEGSGPPDEPGTTRLIGLTDGVVAIALTLLVLQLRVPARHTFDARSASQLAQALGQESRQFTAYVVSFFVIAMFWLVHHRVYHLIRVHRESIAWWNFIYLFTVALFPFSSALMGTYSDNPVAVSWFAANLLLTSLSTSIVFLVARNKGLLIDGVDPEEVRRSTMRGAYVATVVAASIAVAAFNPQAAPYVWLLIFLRSPAAALLSGTRSGARPLPEA